MNSKEQIPKETSRRISALRFVLVLLVIFLHNNITRESAARTGFPYEQGTVGAWVQILVSCLAVGATPVFFVIAAYLQAMRPSPYPVLAAKRIRSLAVPYVLWTLAVMAAKWGGKLAAERLLPAAVGKPGVYFFSGWGARDWLAAFTGYGARGYFPFVEHLWFVRDLLVLSLAAPLLGRAARAAPACFLALCGAAYLCGVTVPALNTQALFFYAVGMCWAERGVDLLSFLDRIRWRFLLPLFLLLVWLAQRSGFRDFPRLCCLTVGASAVLLRLSGALARHGRLFALLRALAPLSFFLYAVHLPLLLGALKSGWLRALPATNTFLCLAEYFGVTALCAGIGTGIGLALRKICPPVFLLLNGGRR